MRVRAVTKKCCVGGFSDPCTRSQPLFLALRGDSKLRCLQGSPRKCKWVQRARGDCGNLERTHPPEEGLVLPPGTKCCCLSLSFSKANQTFKHLCEISDLLTAGNKFKHFKDDYGYRKYVQLDFMPPVKYLCLIHSRVLNGQAAA